MIVRRLFLPLRPSFSPSPSPPSSLFRPFSSSFIPFGYQDGTPWHHSNRRAELISAINVELQRDPEFVSEVVPSLSLESRRRLAGSLQESLCGNNEFAKADTNGDGSLDKIEFEKWLADFFQTDIESLTPVKPSFNQLGKLFIRSGVPMIGFGFLDNSVMILAGDYIDGTIGLAFQISTLAAAALGNTVSDIAGVFLSGSIEAGAERLGLPNPALSAQQMGMFSVRATVLLASLTGICFGCLLGMFPLLFIVDDTDMGAIFKKLDVDKSGFLDKKEIEQAFEMVGIRVTEEEIDHMIKQYDVNGDSRISFEEFVGVFHTLKKKKDKK